MENNPHWRQAESVEQLLEMGFGMGRVERAVQLLLQQGVPPGLYTMLDACSAMEEDDPDQYFDVADEGGAGEPEHGDDLAEVPEAAASLDTPVAPEVRGGAQAFHFDIANVVPLSTNTFLFELLVVGVLRDDATCKVYHRKREDIFLLELPSDINRRCVQSLRSCELLPVDRVEVSAEALSLTRPVFADQACTRIVTREYRELLNACVWLRALANDRFRPSSNDYDPGHDPRFEPITAVECFDLLSLHGLVGQQPSYALIHGLVSYLDTQMTQLGKRYRLEPSVPHVSLTIVCSWLQQTTRCSPPVLSVTARGSR